MSERSLLVREAPSEDAAWGPDKERVPLLDRPTGPSRPWGRVAALAGAAALLLAAVAAAGAAATAVPPSAPRRLPGGTERGGAVGLALVAASGSIPGEAKAKLNATAHPQSEATAAFQQSMPKPLGRQAKLNATAHPESEATGAFRRSTPEPSARQAKLNATAHPESEATGAFRRSTREPSARQAKLNATAHPESELGAAFRHSTHEPSALQAKLNATAHLEGEARAAFWRSTPKPSTRQAKLNATAHSQSQARAAFWRSTPEPSARQAFDRNKVLLTLLPTDAGARCLDGSPAGFYFDRARDHASRTKWVIILEGGAKCFDAEFCQAALASSRGSSTHFQPNLTALTVFIVDGNLESNPHFGTWNRVFVPYCSQDSWSGTRTDKSDETFGFYFSGHIIIQALVRHLVAQEGLGAATDLVFGGYSGGATGSWLNARYVVDQLPALRRMVHLPIAGFFLPDVHWTWGDDTMRLMVHLWQSYMDPNCTANNVGEEHRCILSSHSARYTPWRNFVVQAQSDCVQMGCSETLPLGAPGGCQAPQAESFRTVLMDELQANLKATDGYFLPACVMHHRFSPARPRIFNPAAKRRVSYVEALWDFYNRIDVRLADTCGTNCSDCPR